MSVPLPPLEAYRRDVERRSGSHPFGAADGSWVVLATGLWQHAERTRRALGARPVGAPAEVAAPRPAARPTPRGAARPVARAAGHEGVGIEGLLLRVLDRGWVAEEADVTALEVLAVAAQMEEAEALLLAQAVLSALGCIAEAQVQPLTFGRVLAQRARVERKLGHYDVADDLYADAGRLGTRHALADLQVRADLGRGVLARIRGNYPEARRLFRRGLHRAERAGLRELTGIAHEGLMVAATAADDLDAALQHGWAALAHAAGDAAKEADVLHNLADVCRRAGELDAALQGFLAAAERGAPRIRLAALANAAHLAALLGRHDEYERCLVRCDADLPADGLPYERAQRLLTLAAACDAAGNAERADGYRHRGLELAWAHRFTELLMHHETSGRPVRSAPRGAVRATGRGDGPRTIDAAARRVTRALSALRPGAPVGT